MKITSAAVLLVSAALLLSACSSRTDLPEQPPADIPSDTEAEVIELELLPLTPEEEPAPPEPEVHLSADSIPLGETLILHITNAEADSVSAQTTLPFQPAFYQDGEQLTAFLPVAYTTAPGSYSLTVQAGEHTFEYAISVSEANFEVQHLTIDQSTVSSTNTNAANVEWEQKIEPLKLISDSNRYWDGVFIQPVEGEITTQFGMTRYTNGSTIPTRHSGIDIAAKLGTPIAAANNGRIQFAGYLQLTGNTVVIEHGFGLKSFYYHMDSLTVQTDQMVQKGEQVGTVGSTGYSTGPHLHYSVLVNDVFINPWTAFEKGFE